MRRVSEKGLAFTGSWEWDGKKGYDPVTGLYFPYLDYRGEQLMRAGKPDVAKRFLTIGWGHLCKGEDFSHGVTLARLKQIFEADLLVSEVAIDRYLRNPKTNAPVPLTQNQYDALVDFGHNLGPEAFNPERNTFVRLLNLGDYGAVARIENGEVVGHLLEWCHSAGQFDPGLLKRRKQEGATWCTPDPAPVTAPEMPDEERAEWIRRTAANMLQDRLNAPQAPAGLG